MRGCTPVGSSSPNFSALFKKEARNARRKPSLHPQPFALTLLSRAGNGTRTRDPNLGKVVLYQLSYSRNLSRSSEADTPGSRAATPLPRSHGQCRGTLPTQTSTRRPTHCVCHAMEASGIEPLTS
jgi:hypothetical protein